MKRMANGDNMEQTQSSGYTKTNLKKRRKEWFEMREREEDIREI